MSSSVLVIGGGVAGLALARALAQRGVDCTVVERRQADDSGLGMGLNLPGNATRALAELGVLDPLRSLGVPVRRREYRNGRGRLLFAADDAAFWRNVALPLCLRHGYLIRALRPATPAGVRYGAVVRSVRPEDEYVDVHFEGGQHAERFDFVVGADGVHSTARQAVARSSPRPSRMTRSSWRFIADNPGVDCWTVWSGARSTLLLIPVEEGRVYGYAASTRGASVGTDPEWLRRAFTGFPHVVTRTVAAVPSAAGELVQVPVEDVCLPCWHRGRLLLIGDAAHATAPIWAQGAAMALEDALVLAELLGTRRNWSDVAAAYERARRARVEHVRAVTDSMSRLARLPTALRDITAPVLGPRAYRKAYGPLLADPVRAP